MDSNDIDRLQGLQYFVEFVRRPLLARAEAAERRVAELEAAKEWRPVTGEEPEAGNLVELLVRGYRDEFGTWWYPDGDSPLNGWRPLPPPPQDS